MTGSNLIIDGGWNINWKTAKYEKKLHSLKIQDRHGLHAVNVAPGRSLLIPVSVFEKIGFYDSKNFPQAAADFDFTIRAFNYGFKIFCSYDAKIAMYQGASGGVELILNKSRITQYE